MQRTNIKVKVTAYSVHSSKLEELLPVFIERVTISWPCPCEAFIRWKRAPESNFVFGGEYKLEQKVWSLDTLDQGCLS